LRHQPVPSLQLFCVLFLSFFLPQVLLQGTNLAFFSFPINSFFPLPVWRWLERPSPFFFFVCFPPSFSKLLLSWLQGGTVLWSRIFRFPCGTPPYFPISQVRTSPNPLPLALLLVDFFFFGFLLGPPEGRLFPPVPRFQSAKRASTSHFFIKPLWHSLFVTLFFGSLWFFLTSVSSCLRLAHFSFPCWLSDLFSPPFPSPP